MSDSPKDLYVSSVPGHLVTRFGTGLLIGATRDQKDPSKVTWDEELIVKIPEPEGRAYAKEYARALREKSLKVRTLADFDACNKKLEAASKAEADAAKAAAAAEPTGKSVGKKE